MENSLAELQRLTRELADREAQLISFWKNSRDIHIIAKEDCTLESVSESCLKLLGWTQAELIGKPYINFLHPDDRKQTSKDVRSLSGEQCIRFHNRVLHKDGKYLWIEWTATPFVNGLCYASARPSHAKCSTCYNSGKLKPCGSFYPEEEIECPTEEIPRS